MNITKSTDMRTPATSCIGLELVMRGITNEND